MSEIDKCLICNRIGANFAKTSTIIFTEQNSTHKPLTEVIAEVLEKPIKNQDLFSDHICKRCHNLCTEYNSIKLRLQDIKSGLLTNFKSTLLNYGLSYDTFCSKNVSVPENTIKSPTKIVLPASKLQPLPPDYVINVGNIPIEYHSALSNQKVKTVRSSAPSMLNLKVTVGSSVLTQSIKTTSARPTIQTRSSTQNSPIKLQQNLTTATLISPVLNKSLSSVKVEKEIVSEESSNNLTKMEEECTLLSGNDGDDQILISQEEKESSVDEDPKLQYFDVTLVGDGDDTRDDDADVDDFQETIVMSGDNASILRVMSGQKIVYQNGEISLVVPDDDNSVHEDDEQQDDEQDDSNDESQIEFQVSGDEETANAIIAAAQEQGGAFIKVESGEMFRVQSVKSKKTDSKADNVEHQSMVEQDGNLFKCLVCERNTDALAANSLGTAEAIMMHMKREHNARIYICGVCNKIMRKRSDYTAHIEEHGVTPKKSLETKSRSHECSICLKKFNSRTLMEEHKNVHSGARPYKCNECGKTFSSKYTFQAHLKIHMDRPRPFKCKQCPKSFLTLQNLTQHEKTHLGIKDFVCNVCDKAFGTQHNLEVHGVVHSGSKPFVCLVCSKGFARRAEVRDHMRTHTGERPFACDTCGATFAQRSNLHSHKRATHMDDKRYHCSSCPKKFKRRRLLEYHVKACHTGERPLVCNVCHATFVYPEHYKKHMRIHSGERPFSCEVCGKTFNSRDNRNTHRFVHSDKKPYECLVCGLGYMRKQLLYAHMNTSGHLAESIVVNQPRVQKVVEEVPTSSIEIEEKQDKSLFEADVQTIDENSIIAATNDNTPKIVITNDKQIILQNGNGIITKDDAGTLLMGVAMDGQVEQSQLITADGSAGMFRLVQIQLDNGTTGWIVNE